MGIKSLEELKQLREKYSGKTGLRHNTEFPPAGINQESEYTEILVGMATCGIAAGARETMNEIMKELAENKITGVRVIPVGCMGFCKHEPVIQVNVPGSKSVIYKNVRKDNVGKIIESHIINHTPVESMILDVEIDRI